MNHLQYYRYYETLNDDGNDGDCPCCGDTITDRNCNYDVTDAETGDYVCDDCIGDKQ